ncbi:bifunctional nucleoside/nucleotide kinase/histidine phosphatase family protein [Desulfovibrio litoralis]|uniref:6-phosphofructo-2-kinase n=1 Tax=Desulfovibrio litoralis DSM 11393 TaxID=1121455 RepID=A0A1M7SL84_9BACT|nr:6-phosphofructo-2-kinase/fructose-2,6-bisphosphatase [Desulfovibrio litoralis]SHN59214.1 6-phosphofructo-2-kinase [Desulfovibrio litoralis DSM 11393]
MQKLYIVMVGLPARGKSIVARRLLEGLEGYGLKVKIFNNGELRRSQFGVSSASPDFYSPDNLSARKYREDIYYNNIAYAKSFLEQGGHIAILDATNSSPERRKSIEHKSDGIPVFFIECINEDEEMLNTSILRKSMLPEFDQLDKKTAIKWFKERIEQYKRVFVGLKDEKNYIKFDTLNSCILDEKLDETLPYYVEMRDILISDWIQHLYLVRHAESQFNLEHRIGGDPSLTQRGWEQARALARHFQAIPVPFVFTSTKKRSQETASILIEQQKKCIVHALPEFDEIHAGICEGLTYKEIAERYPKEYLARKKDKYNYCYPQGEGYASLYERVYRGLKKALFLSGAAAGTMIVGHQAINRMILANFNFRRTRNVPYISIPQEQYFHIILTHRKKMVEMVPIVPLLK